MMKSRMCPIKYISFWWKSPFRSLCYFRWPKVWQTITYLIWEKIHSICHAPFGMTLNTSLPMNSKVPDFTVFLNSRLQRMPFSWKTPSGYMIAFLDELVSDIVGTATYVPLISFIVGSCWLLITFIKDISSDLSSIEAEEISNKTVDDSKKLLCKIIKFYTDIRGWGREACENSIHSYLLMRISHYSD